MAYNEINITGTHTFRGTIQKNSDPEFDNDSHWDKTNWTVSGGVGTGTSGSQNGALNNQTTQIEAEKNYALIYYINSRTGGCFSVVFSLGGKNAPGQTSVGSEGVVNLLDTDNSTNIKALAAGGAGTCEVEYIRVFEIVDGPTGSFVWDGSTMLNGEKVYTSESTFEGNNWNLAFDSSDWLLSQIAGTAGASSWSSPTIDGTYTASGNATDAPTITPTIIPTPTPTPTPASADFIEDLNNFTDGYSNLSGKRIKARMQDGRNDGSLTLGSSL